MLDTFGMLDCSPIGTPLSARTIDGPPIKSTPLNTKKFDYPALVGKLLYLSNCTRPDITVAVILFEQIYDFADRCSLGTGQACVTIRQGNDALYSYVLGKLQPSPSLLSRCLLW